MQRKRTGSVLIVVVFIVALMSAVVMGILEVNTEEIQLMQNHVEAAQAQAVAEAGLNDALAELRADAAWDTGFSGKSFNGGTYTAVLEGSTITVTGTTAKGFVARLEADLTVSEEGPPHVVRIDALRINE
jgi:type II secretory pathway component PulK